MTSYRSPDYVVGLVRELCRLPRETEWVEFKHNKAEPEDIGEYISALANAAALAGKAHGYMVWGIEDRTHRVVGTAFDPSAVCKGNEELENWLLRLLSPKILFRFYRTEVDGQPVVLLEIERAFRHPVQFQGQEFIRVGSYKKPLKNFPEKERALWRIFDQTPFEKRLAAERQSEEDVLRLLDFTAYFDLLERPLPADRQGVIAALKADDLIEPCEAGGWNITNLGAVLFAKNLNDFRALQRRSIRVVIYRGTGRMFTERELGSDRGYAAGFEELMTLVNGLLPANEVMGQALRRSVPMFPELAVRELVANALIHQDFFVTGAGPMIEIFDDRLMIINPGQPLVDTQRFLDTPPQSRNEGLASLMRRFRICEERGSGIDKVVFQVEQFQLPAPLFEVREGSTRAVLFAHRTLSEMDKADRIRACYLHACLRHEMRLSMTNTSVRERFGIPEKNAATASRLLTEAVESGLVVIEDPQAGTRIRRYLPFWAVATSGGQIA